MVKQLTIGTFIPSMMAVTNILVEILIVTASKFTRPINQAKNVIDSIAGISWIQYINLGTVLITVSIHYDL
jgi:hypothetical protein